MAEHTLKDKLRAATETGSLTLTEQDIAAPSAQPTVTEPVGDVQVPVPEIAKRDILVEGAAGGKPAPMALAPGNSSIGNLAGAESLSAIEMVTLTDADRQAFIEALVTGRRYTRPFSIFGGAISGTIRCRAAQESEAIAAYLASQLRKNAYPTALDYSLALRNILLAAQIETINGTAYMELKSPLLATQDGSTLNPPGWLEQADVFGKMPEAILSGLYGAVYTFERRYWTMIENAANQDFWVPVKSI